MELKYCDPPHRVGRPEQVIDLANQFVIKGWDHTKPDLVGYWYKGRVQLLSGSHRYAAAKLAGLTEIPVRTVSYKLVKECWGTPMWTRWLMRLGDKHEAIGTALPEPY